MRRYTTPTLVLNVTGVDLTNYHTEVTIRQGYVVETFVNPTCVSEYNGCIITLSLTQKQTAKFKGNKAEIQIRFVDENGYADATDIKTVTISDVLREGVIEYANGD